MTKLSNYSSIILLLLICSQAVCSPVKQIKQTKQKVYIVVCGIDSDFLEKDVNKKIAQGYWPVGGVSGDSGHCQALLYKKIPGNYK